MSDSVSTDGLPNGAKPAGVLRRFGAMFYDLLLVVALWMVATALLLPLTGGEAIEVQRHGLGAYAYQALLLALVVGFFGWFWTRGGQTVGMMAWRLRLVREDGARLSWMDAIKRLAGAAVSWAVFGLGYFWIWIDRDRRAWHDRWTHTRVVVLPKR